MIQAQLDSIKENSAAVLIQYSNGLVDAMLGGAYNVDDIFEHCLRLHYLYGIIDEARLSGADVYVGDTELTGSVIEQVYHKIWHYSGIFANIDLSNYSSITADDGDQGVPSGEDGASGSDDHYRAGSLAVNAGSGTVTFYKDGVASPLANADYQLTVYVTTASGYEQRNIVVSAKYTSGFTYSDVLEAGTLHYVAELDT